MLYKDISREITASKFPGNAMENVAYELHNNDPMSTALVTGW